MKKIEIEDHQNSKILTGQLCYINFDDTETSLKAIEILNNTTFQNSSLKFSHLQYNFEDDISEE